MLNWIDRLAGWWMDWRIDRAVAANPELHRVGIEKVEFDENGFHLIASFPGIYLLADEVAAMLEANNAENYVQFDMLPRIDRRLPPIRVTVQWAMGKSPAQRVLELESAWEQAVNFYPDLESLVPLGSENGIREPKGKTRMDIDTTRFRWVYCKTCWERWRYSQNNEEICPFCGSSDIQLGEPEEPIFRIPDKLTGSENGQ